MHKTLIVSKEEISTCIDIEAVVEIVEKVIKWHGEKKVVLPPKITLPLGAEQDWPTHNASINAMPAYIEPMDVAGIKWAGGFWNNHQRNLPTVMATIILNDPDKGLPLAVMDGSWITDFRTAAVSYVGAKYLGKDNIQTIAICGAGTQGRTHAKVFDEMLNLSGIRIYDVNERELQRFKEDTEQTLSAEVVTCSSLSEVTEEVDVLITATIAKEPFLDFSDVAKGTHISAIGSYSEIKRNIVESCDKIVVDNLKQAKHRGNLKRFFSDGSLREDDIYSEMGSLLTGERKGREQDSECTLCVPIGMGTEDIAIAYWIFQHAQDLDLGTEYNFKADTHTWELV